MKGSKIEFEIYEEAGLPGFMEEKEFKEYCKQFLYSWKSQICFLILNLH
jgi:hypothetical protein